MSHLNSFYLQCCISILLIGTTIQAQSDQLFFLGHSLSDRIPEMIHSFGEGKGENIEYSYAQIIGSPLAYQWSCLRTPSNWPGDFPDGHIYPFYHPDEGLASGKFDHLILNEGVPRLDNKYGIEVTKKFVDSFYHYAIGFNPEIQVYLCELWHCLDSGTPTGCHYDEDSNPWRERLDDDLPIWEKAIDYLNDTYNPDKPLRLIPSGQALAAFYDSIYAGNVPGITQIDQVFDDRIHGNDTIRYLVACVNYASIYEESPVGLTNETFTWWGGALGEITPELALQLQTIAWETVCNYPHNNIDCLTTNQDNLLEESFTVSPNPNQGFFQLLPRVKDDIKILNIDGKLIFEGNNDELNQFLPLQSGVYFLQAKSSSGQVEKIIVR